MIFYRVVYDDGRIQWVTVKAEALRADPGATEHDIGTTKPEILALLNECETRIHELRTPVVTSNIKLPSYTETAVAMEDAWDKLPLKLKLHFASLAMEAARDILSDA